MKTPKNTGHYAEVIETSLMCNKTRHYFQDLLEGVKTDDDLAKFQSELSQWLERHLPQTFKG